MVRRRLGRLIGDLALRWEVLDGQSSELDRAWKGGGKLGRKDRLTILTRGVVQHIGVTSRDHF